MTFIHTIFTEQHIKSIETGLRSFIQLLALAEKEEFEAKWQPDEYDLISAIYTIQDFIISTSNLNGYQKYRNIQYDWIEELHNLTFELFLDGIDEKTKIKNRRRFLNMHHLVINPIIDALSTLQHQFVLDHLSAITNDIIVMIQTNNYYGTYDDAIVARELIKEQIRQKEIKCKRPNNNYKEFDFDYLMDDVDELNFET